MSLARATEQALDAIVAKNGAKWSEDYRRRFAAMVEDVKNYKPGNPAETKKENKDEQQIQATSG